MKTLPLCLMLVVALLTGCQTAPTHEGIVVPPKYGDNIAIPKVDPLAIKPLEWKLLNRAELLQYLKDHQDGDFTLYTLDDGNMTIMIGNMQEMKRYVQSQKAVIEYLQTIIDAHRVPEDKPQQQEQKAPTK